MESQSYHISLPREAAVLTSTRAGDSHITRTLTAVDALETAHLRLAPWSPEQGESLPRMGSRRVSGKALRGRTGTS